MGPNHICHGRSECSRNEARPPHFQARNRQEKARFTLQFSLCLSYFVSHSDPARHSTSKLHILTACSSCTSALHSFIRRELDCPELQSSCHFSSIRICRQEARPRVDEPLAAVTFRVVMDGAVSPSSPLCYVSISSPQDGASCIPADGRMV
jgi:hypothetical protein